MREQDVYHLAQGEMKMGQCACVTFTEAGNEGREEGGKPCIVPLSFPLLCQGDALQILEHCALLYNLMRQPRFKTQFREATQDFQGSTLG